VANVAAGDIWRGSYLSIGFETNLQDRGQRRFLIEGLSSVTDDKEVLTTAIDEALSAAATPWKYPEALGGEPVGIPISYTRARRWSKDKVYVDVYYRRASFSLPAEPISVVADTYPVEENVAVYRDTTPFMSPSNAALFSPQGLPAGRIKELGEVGDYKGEKSATDIKPYPYRISAIRLVGYVQLAFNPYRAGIAALQGYTNSSRFTLGGFLHQPGQLRFDGARVRQLSPGPNQNEPSFAVQYQFTASQRFFQQKLVWLAAGPGGTDTPYRGNPTLIQRDLTDTLVSRIDEWATVEEPAYPSVDFQGRFPGYQ
jgi:hypothetical protein